MQRQQQSSQMENSLASRGETGPAPREEARGRFAPTKEALAAEICIFSDFMHIHSPTSFPGLAGIARYLFSQLIKPSPSSAP